MELHKEQLLLINDYQPDLNISIQKYFDDSYRFVNKFYSNELNYYLNLDFHLLTIDNFYQEYIWCVHTAGFSAKIVGKHINNLLKIYSPYYLYATTDFNQSFESLKLICNNQLKSQAIWKLANILITELKTIDWLTFKNQHLNTPEKLQRLPYIGKITCFHLARNIGLLDSVKPDLHLTRLATHFGFKTPIEMCQAINSDLPLGIIDLILWYAASTFSTLSIKKDNR